jgi:predicted Fe-S protein YdhL (DUF1289 family)
MTEYTSSKIDSPCIGICAIDEANGLCRGCYRNINEIKTWFEMSQAEKTNLLITLEERQLQQANFDD